MQYKVKQLRDSISKKSIVLKNKYLYRLVVRKGDFVTPGSALAKVKDASSAKLVLFLEPDELGKIAEKNVYFDGRKTVYKIDKLWKIADEKFISSYRAEIYIPAPKESFSKLVKVEIK